MLLSCLRYKQAFIWNDYTIDYFSETASTLPKLPKFKTAVLGITVGQVNISFVHTFDNSLYLEWYVCQRSDTRPGEPLSSIPQQAWPSLAIVNATIRADTARWSPVTCPGGHTTRVFLACDVSAFCWAGHRVTFSLRPELWALPTPQTCQTRLAMTSLPPSFPCRSVEQRVPYSLVCDHRRDCADDSDEMFCTFRPCQRQYQLQCLNKQVCEAQLCLCLSQRIYYALIYKILLLPCIYQPIQAI